MTETLRRPEEMSVGDWHAYLRRDGSGGRVPRSDEPAVPSTDELAEAGWGGGTPAANKGKIVWAENGPTAAELIEGGTGTLWHELRAYEIELEYVIQGGLTHAENPAIRQKGLRNRIAQLQVEIAAAEAGA
jgi:hypothetical protein